MLTKFESKSNRVKGLSFHPVRPWILASLHNGQIQLWDYRMGTCLDRFEEHDGPVRGVDFHPMQPLIVSGGDDYKVKVWDYKLRRCLYTLLGHLDYIRTVQFHVEYPWIVSASDDQTVRIWNWQSRSCISVLTGHNHYVMCAAFHPKDDLIVSASLDQTVRVWDTTGLRKKTVRGTPAQIDDGNVVSRVNNELFGGNDALVKYVLEGHERGVNWASFHPTLPLVISGADDRQVKLWRMNETKAWEVDTMRGHTNNVSCVLFHPKHELIVSNSEDRTIRVWDISKRLGVQTFRRESDRFWILAAHPEQNLLAAGHDSGMTVFKLERERPAYDVVGTKCFYVKERYLRLHDIINGRDVPLVSLRRSSGHTSPGTGGGPRNLTFNSFNRQENNIIITSDADGGTYELIVFGDGQSGSGDAQDVRRGPGLAAVFVARDRFVVLDKSRQLIIKSLQNETKKKVNPPLANIDGLYQTGVSGRIILRSDDRVILYDQQANKIVNELQVARVKYVIWRDDFSMVAILSKHQIVLANKSFEQICTVNETVRVKGGAWDGKKPVFIYTTLNHVKYVLPNGDVGIVRGLEVPIYVTRVSSSTLHCLDREGKARGIEIDTTEAQFKLALDRRDYPEVMRMVKHSRLCGQAIISYLQEKGFPEVALHFVQDSKSRFKLALACGNIQVAMGIALELGDEAWGELGVEALRQGNHEVVEMCYQKTRQFEKLSFLYLITGNTKKLRYMLRIAESRSNMMSRFHNALFLGEAEERVNILQATGQLSLAYICAKTHGLNESAEKIEVMLNASSIPIPSVDMDGALLLPPTPILRAENWPLLQVGKGALADLANAGSANGDNGAVRDVDIGDDAAGAEWGDDDDLFSDDEGGDGDGVNEGFARSAPKGPSAWADDDSLDLSEDGDDMDAEEADTGSDIFVVPTPGVAVPAEWCNASAHAADHFAAGSVDSAVQLLSRQIGAVNIHDLKSAAIASFLGSTAFLPTSPLAPAIKSYMKRDSVKSNDSKTMKSLPCTTVRSEHLHESLKTAYRAFTSGQFTDCMESMQNIIVSIPLVIAGSRNETNELKELLDICREYITALRIKATMAECKDDIPRSLELAAYFTHCNLQRGHLLLALKNAMVAAFKNKNYINAAAFARRLLELPDVNSERHAETRSKAQKVVQKSEKEGRNEHEIDYDEMNPFSLDCNVMKPIYKGSPLVKCPYCSSAYLPETKGKTCNTCKLSQIGVDTVGLVTQATYSR